MRQETAEDITREQKAMILLSMVAERQGYPLTQIRKGSRWGVDFTATMTNPDGTTITKVIEVKGVKGKSIREPGRLIFACRKWVKIDNAAKKAKGEGVIVWAYEDGILFMNHTQVSGKAEIFGRRDRDLTNDQEPIVWVDITPARRALYEHNGTLYGG